MGEKLLALDPKRRRFIEEYTLDWNATQAAIRAGYSAKTAKEQGSRLLTFVNVQKALAEVMQEASERCQISADAILRETANLAFVNMIDYMRIGENGEPFVDVSALTRAQGAGLLSFKYKEYKDGRGEDARDVAEVEIRINTSKFSALVKLGEYVGVFGKKDDKPTIDVTEYERIISDEAIRRERCGEIADRFTRAIPATPKQIEGKAVEVKAKAKPKQRVSP